MKKLMVLAMVLLTLTTTIYAKEKTVNDGKIGKYVTVEIDTTGTKDFDAIEEVSFSVWMKESQMENCPVGLHMIKIPGKNYEVFSTEISQCLYEFVMGENPSNNKGDNYPVENINWYDAIIFCNKLSEKMGLMPVYAVNGKTDTTEWNYTYSSYYGESSIIGDITQDSSASGYRLPTVDEWKYAAKGGQDFKFAGSDNLDEVGWYNGNSEIKTHPVGQKKANGYGLYDMSGNVWEWCWDKYGYYSYKNGKSVCGGSFNSYTFNCDIYDQDRNVADYIGNWGASTIGFRIVRTVNK